MAATTRCFFDPGVWSLEFSFQNKTSMTLLIFLYLGAATDMIAVMGMQNVAAAKPKQTSIGGRARTRKLSAVLQF